MPETLQDLIEGLAIEVSKMSDQEKTEFRRGWIRKTPRFFRRGDEVSVRQFNGKLLKGHIVSVLESVSGRKIKVISGPLVVTVSEEQVSLIGVKQK
jgi:hypothetical protein